MDKEKIVRTKEELIEAKNMKYPIIIVKGELATQLHKAKKVMTMSKWALIPVVSVLALAVPTGGASLAIGSMASFGTVTSLAYAIIAVGGISIVTALFLGYEEVEFNGSVKGEVYFKLKRK